MRTTVDYWCSPVTGMLSEIEWRNEGMIQPNVNSMRLEWKFNPTDGWPKMDIAKPTSRFGRYKVLLDARDSEAYVRVLLPKGIAAELEVLIGETRVTSTSDRLDVRGAPGLSGGVYVAGRGVVHSRRRLTIVCGAVKNSSGQNQTIGGSRIMPRC